MAQMGTRGQVEEKGDEELARPQMEIGPTIRKRLFFSTSTTSSYDIPDSFFQITSRRPPILNKFVPLLTYAPQNQPGRETGPAMGDGGGLQKIQWKSEEDLARPKRNGSKIWPGPKWRRWGFEDRLRKRVTKSAL